MYPISWSAGTWAPLDWTQVRNKRNVDGVDLIKLVPTRAEMEALMQRHDVNQDDAIVVVSKGANSKNEANIGWVAGGWHVEFRVEKNTGIGIVGMRCAGQTCGSSSATRP